MYNQPVYPVVQFLLRYGSMLSIGVGILPLLGVAVGVLLGAPLWIVLPGIVVSALIWLLLKSYVEVLAIIADTLLPK